MFKLTEEEKAKIASGEWTLENVIAARLSAPANVNTDTPEELEAKRTTAAESMLGYKPLESVVNESVGDGTEEADETEQNVVKVITAPVTDKRQTLTPEQLKAKYEADMKDYSGENAAASAKATEQMKNYGYEDPIKKNIREAVEAEIAKSNPERKTDLSDYKVPENKEDEGPSIWSKIASMLPSMKKAGTAMTGWTRYNGGSSPIAAAYNNWLQGEKTRNAQAASQGANAILQEQITKLNNEKASENLEASKRAEVKAKSDATDDANFRTDNGAFSNQYNQIESAIESAKLELEQIDPSDTKKKQDLEKQITALETQRRTVLKNMKDNAESYGKPISKRYQSLFDKYLTDEKEEPKAAAPVAEETEHKEDKPAQPTYDLTDLKTEADQIEAEKGKLRGDWRFAKDEIAYNKKVKAFNKKLKELGVPSSALGPLSEVAVPTQSKPEIDAKRAEWVENELKKTYPNGRPSIAALAKLYDAKKAELEKKAKKMRF